MRYSLLVAILTVLTVALMFLEGAYVFHWITVLVFGLILSIILFGWEIGLPPIELELGGGEGRKRDEVKSLATIIKRAEKSPTARAIVRERLIEIYSTASDDYSETYSRLRSNPTKALRILDGPDFERGLEEALKILEAGLNEN